MKKQLLRLKDNAIILVCMALLIIGMLNSCGIPYTKEHRQHILISNNQQIPVYQQANLKGKIIHKVPNNTKCKLLWYNDNWACIRITDHNVNNFFRHYQYEFVPSNYIKELTDTFFVTNPKGAIITHFIYSSEAKKFEEVKGGPLPYGSKVVASLPNSSNEATCQLKYDEVYGPHTRTGKISIHDIKHQMYVQPTSWPSGFYTIKGKDSVPLLHSHKESDGYGILYQELDTIGWLEPGTAVMTKANFWSNSIVDAYVISSKNPQEGYVYCHYLHPEAWGKWKSTWWPIRWFGDPSGLSGSINEKSSAFTKLLTRFFMFLPKQTSLPVWQRYGLHGLGLIIWLVISLLIMRSYSIGNLIFSMIWNVGIPVLYMTYMPYSLWFVYPKLVTWLGAILGSVYVITLFIIFGFRCKTYTLCICYKIPFLKKVMFTIYGIMNGFLCIMLVEELITQDIWILVLGLCAAVVPPADYSKYEVLEGTNGKKLGQSLGNKFYSLEGKVYETDDYNKYYEVDPPSY